MWLGKLPDSPLGRRVIRQLDKQGIGTHVEWCSSDTRQGLIFREARQAPRESKSWYDRRNTATTSAEPSDFPMETVQSAEMVFVGRSTLLLSEDAANTTQALMHAGGGSGAVTATDLDYKPGFATPKQYRMALDALSDQLDVLVANEEEAKTILNLSGGARELANVIATEYNRERTVITRGSRGAVAMHNTPGTNVIHEREPIHTEDTADPTGQHGAFVGGYLKEPIDGSDSARALSVAVATATLTRTVPGPFLTLTADELEPVIKQVIEQSQ